MIDIETLGNTTTAPIVQVGAVCFEETPTGEYQEIGYYDTNVYFNSALSYGDVGGDTVEWWLSQSDEARESITKKSNRKTTTLKEALIGLSNFIKQAKGDYVNKSYEFSLEYWGHATFDIPILNHGYNKTWQQTPFYFRACRDLRTLESLYQTVKGEKYEWTERQGTYHCAVDDARHQAKNLNNMLYLLKNS